VPLVGNGPDHVTANPLARAREDGRFAPAPVAAAALALRPPAPLVQPVTFGPSLQRLPVEGRLALFQPAAHGLGALGSGPGQRLLGSEAPMPHVPPDGPGRQAPVLPFRSQLLGRSTAPTREGQPELVRIPSGNQPYQGGGLKGPPTTPPPATPLGTPARHALAINGVQPVIGHPTGGSNETGGLRGRQPRIRHGLPATQADRFVGLRRPFSGIVLHHP
jgi:hypothetical protein